jgi:putative DNA primase/helicase
MTDLTNGNGRNGHPPHADEKVYTYRDEQGEPLFEVVRQGQGARKKIWQRLPGRKTGGIDDARRVLYRLPELLKTDPDATVLIVEGEKDAENLWGQHLPATTNPHGACRWRDEYSEWLRDHLPGRRFVIVPDNDDEGRKHEAAVRLSLKKAGIAAAVLNLDGLPEKGDVSDWLALAGNTVEQFAALAAEAVADVGAAKLRDDTVARRWAAQERDRFMFLNGGQWWRYEGICWRYAGGDVAETEMIRFLRSLRKEYPDQDVTPKRAKDALSLARADLGPIMPDALNPRKDWIPLANGVYDVGTGELLPHDPAHRITSYRAYAFDPAAVCPRWLKFLCETVITEEGRPCADWIGAIQEWFGYCLIADPNRAQTAMVWVGEGGNGKGVATRVLEGLVGEGNHLAVPIEQLPDPYYRAALLGKLVGFVNEPDRQAMRKGGQVVKAITGGDEIDGRKPLREGVPLPRHHAPARLVQQAAGDGRHDLGLLPPPGAD